MVKIYTDKELLDKVKTLKDYKAIPEKRWLLAVRSKEDSPNVYDDKLYIFEGEKFIDVMSCTTNPGTPSLKGGYRKYNKKGAAVISSNQWCYDSYEYGLHNGKMIALRQIGDINYFRDNNNDNRVDEEGQIYLDNYNTNIHSNTYKYWSVKEKQKYIGEWSHGCIVVNDRIKYKSMIDYFKKEKNKVTLCILKEF